MSGQRVWLPLHGGSLNTSGYLERGQVDCRLLSALPKRSLGLILGTVAGAPQADTLNNQLKGRHWRGVSPGPRSEQATSQCGPFPPCSVSKHAWVCWPEARSAWQLPDSSLGLSDKPRNLLVAGKSRGQDWDCHGGPKSMTTSECQVAWQNRSCPLLSGWRSDFGAG